MANVKEITLDTLGVTGAQDGAKLAEGMFFQDKRAGKLLTAATSGAMQVMQPNIYYDLTTNFEERSGRIQAVRGALDIVSTIGAIALGTVGGQPEIAVVAKVVYNAVSSKINRDRASKPATSQV